MKAAAGLSWTDRNVTSRAPATRSVRTRPEIHAVIILSERRPIRRQHQFRAFKVQILHLQRTENAAIAAKSIGVATLPLDGGAPGDQVFAEERVEIEKLAREDPTLFEQGGTAARTAVKLSALI